jgi:hypothetical protein
MIDKNLKGTFDRIFKLVVTPIFMKVGFKRRANYFARQTNDIVQTVTIHKSRENIYNNSQSFGFAFGFYNSEISRIALKKNTIPDFPKTKDCFVESFLGVLTHHKEFWYELKTETNCDELELKVVRDLTELLIPIFDKYNSLENLTDFIERYYKRKIFPAPESIIVFYMLTDQRQKGIAAIKDNYALARTPQVIEHSISTSSDQHLESVEIGYINQHYIDKIQELATFYDVDL